MTDIIERSPMHTEDQLHKLADVIMALIRPAFKAEVLQIIEENSVPVPEVEVDEQITDWMRLNFDISDYYEFDIHEHEYEIGTMIDDRMEEKEDDSDFDERVFKALGKIDMKFGNMTITHESQTIVKE